MLINDKHIDNVKLMTASNYAREKGIDRKNVYVLMSRDDFDYIKIDDIIFVYLNEKIKSYNRKR